MKFPKLKNPLLCIILQYVVVIVGFYIPAILVGILFEHPLVVVISIIACTLALLIFMFKNFGVLMLLDTILSLLHCYYSARKSYKCKRNGTNPEKIKKRILKRVIFFGRKKEVSNVSPTPDILKYSAKSSLTVFYKGIDKLFLTYSVNFLDDNTLENISKSAKINIKQYAGKGKRLLLDPSQKKEKVTVASVVVVFADKVEEKTKANLFKTLSKNNGDGELESTLICVIDLENAIYYFDSVRESFTGFGYPAKNRAYHMIRKYVFGRKINIRKNKEYVDLPKGLICYNKDKDTLWSLWRSIKNENENYSKTQKKIFKKLQDGECVFDDDVFYCKIGQRAVDLLVENNEESKIVTVKYINMWSYPKANKISKKDTQAIKNKAELYFNSQGYNVIFEEI